MGMRMEDRGVWNKGQGLGMEGIRNKNGGILDKEQDREHRTQRLELGWKIN